MCGGHGVNEVSYGITVGQTSSSRALGGAKSEITLLKKKKVHHYHSVYLLTNANP